jgi:hypothetical protein
VNAPSRTSASREPLLFRRELAVLAVGASHVIQNAKFTQAAVHARRHASFALRILNLASRVLIFDRASPGQP